MKALVLAAALAAGSAQIPAAEKAPQAGTATLTVNVENVSPKGGIVRMALYQAGNYDDNDHPTADGDAVAHQAGTTIVLKGLKPGEYAIKMMQDINKNGEFDRSWIGLPLEPYGFSNNVVVGLGEPSFDSTKFKIVAGENTITVKLSDTDGLSVPAPRTDRITTRDHHPKSYE